MCALKRRNGVFYKTAIGVHVQRSSSCLLAENMTGTTGSTKGRMAAVRDAWHALSDAERQIYQDKAASDKRRYELQRSGLLPGDVDWENMPPEDKEHFEGLMRERRALLVELASGAAGEWWLKTCPANGTCVNIPSFVRHAFLARLSCFDACRPCPWCSPN